MVEPLTPPPIRYRTYIKAPPARVFESLTTGAGWDAWFTQGTEVEARPGGRIRFRWIDWAVDHYTTDAEGPILEITPPTRFVFQWKPGDSTTTIAFEIKPLGEGSVVEVEESGYTSS